MSVVLPGSATFNPPFTATSSTAVKSEVYVSRGDEPNSKPQKIEFGSATIEYVDDAVILDPKNLVVGTPHPFRFEGHWLLAVKHQDESLEFFYLPT